MVRISLLYLYNHVSYATHDDYNHVYDDYYVHEQNWNS